MNTNSQLAAYVVLVLQNLMSHRNALGHMLSKFYVLRAQDFRIQF